MFKFFPNLVVWYLAGQNFEELRAGLFSKTFGERERERLVQADSTSYLIWEGRKEGRKRETEVW